ncbi:MAG: cytochrome b/b6 domain-containing protein [Magnetococcus sp. WYHC-3]
MTHRVLMIPPWLRLWHWSNAACFLALIYSGSSLHFAGTALDGVLLDFANARKVHNVAGLTLAALYLFFLVQGVRSGNLRQYFPRLDASWWQELWAVMGYYGGGIFKGAPHPFVPTPERKFNPLQQVTYLGVTLGGLPLLIASGVLFFFPEVFPDQILGMGGIWPLAVGHYLIAFFLTLFLVGHVYIITCGATLTSELKMMITGWHEHKDSGNE